MKFPELEINNFLAITNAKVNLADRGLVLIQGDNQADSSADSNGVGKSSIVEALEWCWFGETARGLAGDGVINNVAKKDCFVKSVAVDGHITYTATRHRKHKTGKNTFTLKSFDGVKETDLTKGTEKLTEEVARGIIGCSLDVFSAAIYAAQEKMPDLPAMTDKNLKLIIEEASGASLLEGAHKKAREGLAAAQQALQVAQAAVQKAVDHKDFLTGQKTFAQGQVVHWNNDRATREEQARNAVAAVLPHIRVNKETLEKLDEAKLRAGIADCDSKIGLVAAEQTGLQALERTLANAKAQLAAFEGEIEMFGRWHGEAVDAAKKIEHQVGCPCSACGRPLTEAELGTAKMKAEELIESRAKAQDEAIKKFKEQEKLVADAQRARDEFAATMTDITAVAAQRSVFERELATFTDLSSKQQQLVNTAKGWRDRLVEIQAEENPHEATIKRLEGEIAAVDTQIADLRKKVTEAEEEVALETAAVQVYGPAGARAQILDDVTPFLNAQTAKYLAILSDGNIEAIWTTLTPDSKGNLKEKFTIDVNNALGGDNFKAVSGGEKRKVRIATALALQDLVATRATKPIELWIGDEIDDALDKSGLERLMQILEEKARERGSVFVISHNELRDHIKQVLLVEKLPTKETRITEMAA